jgi:hypothetical protein
MPWHARVIFLLETSSVIVDEGKKKGALDAPPH